MPVPVVTFYGQCVTLGAGFLDPSAEGPARTRCGTRRMDSGRDKAIAAAVLKVLSEVGYRRMTMDEVAVAAGVSKATIYRRWSTKSELLISVLDVASQDAVTVPDTGELKGDLVVLLQSLLDVFSGPGGRATRAVLSAVIDDSVLSDAYQRGPLARWSQTLAAVFDRAADRGEVAAGAGATLGAEAGPAILVLRWLINGRELNESVVAAVVDEVMMPLLNCHRPQPNSLP